MTLGSQTALIMHGSWCRATSRWPEAWSSRDRALGQDDVSSLALHSRIGGRLLTGELGGQTHYWNLTVSGVELDMTLYRFGGLVPLKGEEILATDLMAMDGVTERYRLLERRIHEASFVLGMLADDYSGPAYEVEQ